MPGQSDPKVSLKKQGGFFSIYKSGQGYWTRLGTGAVASLIIAFSAYFLWATLPRFVSPDQLLMVRLIVVCVFAIAAGMLTWWLMNSPKRATFLIETDAEMKKVNWSSMHDLIGSTRVVIFFMLAIVAVLFLYDLAFQTFFYSIGVLKTNLFQTMFGGPPPTP